MYKSTLVCESNEISHWFFEVSHTTKAVQTLGLVFPNCKKMLSPRRFLKTTIKVGGTCVLIKGVAQQALIFC